MSDARAEDVSPGATTARTINRSFSILELGRRQEHKRQVAAFDRENVSALALSQHADYAQRLDGLGVMRPRSSSPSVPEPDPTRRAAGTVDG